MQKQDLNVLKLSLIFNFFIVMVFSYSVVVSLFDEWWSTGPYNHGLLGILLTLYVFWTKKDFFTSVRPNIAGVILLCLVNFIFLIANLANIGQLQILSLALIVGALLFTFYGFIVIKVFFRAWLMLLLTLPIWNILQLPLREISTWIGFHSVDTLGYEIIRSGYHLITPGGVFVVETACSGLGFFLASALYAIFVSQINNLSYKSTTIFLLLATSFAIIANWLRIIIIVIVGSKTQMQHFIVQDHLTFGWLVFMGFFIPLIIIGHIYFPEQAQVKHKIDSSLNQAKLKSWAPISVTLITLVFALSTLFISSRVDENYKFLMPNLPSYKHVSSGSITNHNWFPTSEGATDERFDYFIKNDNVFKVYSANYIQQRQNSEIINIGNSLFDKNRWYNPQQEIIHLNDASPLKQANLLILQKNKQRSRLISYWYLVNGRYVNDKLIAKWYEIKAALSGKPGATLIAIAFDFQNKDKQHAIETLTTFSEAFASQPITIK